MRTPRPASKSKRLIHTFYLVQPVLQFFALVAILGYLNACSPLAPSTTKGGNSEGPNQPAQSARAEAKAQEELVQSTLKEIGGNTLDVVAESQFDQTHRDILVSDRPFEESDVKERMLRRSLRALGEGLTVPPKLLLIPLSAEQQTALWRDGHVRIDLEKALASGGKAKKALFEALKSELAQLNVDAVGHLVIPDSAMREEFEELSLTLQISLAIVSPDKAYLELHKVKEEGQESQAPLLEAALRAARHFAVTLE